MIRYDKQAYDTKVADTPCGRIGRRIVEHERDTDLPGFQSHEIVLYDFV